MPRTNRLSARAPLTLLAAALLAGLMATDSTAQTFDSSAGPLQVTRMAGPFERPWAVAFLPDGARLVTERDGRLWHLDPGMNRREVTGVPQVRAEGQGGLLDVVAARDFAGTREIFLSYAEPVGGRSRTAAAVARLSEDNARLENLRVIFRQQPATPQPKHYGSRIVEAPDGTLWITVGERGERPLAQDMQAHHGKVVRVARDGSVPPDNPFVGRTGLDEIWSLGHRNPQGAALDPESGQLWVVEHGAQGGDEVNQPQPGRNYGWPVISYGRHYSGAKIGEGTQKPGMEQPAHYWDPSIAPSGMAIYSGRLWPEWQGDIFVGALKYQLIARIEKQGSRLVGEERLFQGKFGRIRDVREGPDGALWFLTDAGRGWLYRITPAD